MRRLLLITGLMLAFSGNARNLNGDVAHNDTENIPAIIEASGVKAGLCVHLGVTDGTLTATLGKNKNFLVHGLTADADMVRKARQQITAQGLYGRVSVEHSSLGRLPYADSLVNLLVVRDFANLQNKGLELAEVVRVLAPNGTACLDGKVPSSGKDYQVLKKMGNWTLITKPLPTGSDEWIHQNYDTTGNRVSKDDLVGPPQRLRWLSGVPWRMPDYAAKSMVVGGGRVYYVINESSIRKTSWPYLSVRDAFSGVLLWKRAGSPLPLTMIAAGERFYMSSGEQNEELIAVDSTTGKLLIHYDQAPNPRWALLHKDNLLVACNPGSQLKCLDPATGKVRWTCQNRSIEPGGGLTNAAILDGKILYAERRKGTIGCLDLATGAEQWHRQVIDEIGGDKGGHLCAVQPGTMILYNAEGAHAFSTVDGKYLWTRVHEVLGSPTRRKAKSFRDGFFIDGLYWTHVGDIDPTVPAKYRYLRNRTYSWQGLDPTTGKVKKTFLYPDGVKVGASCFPDQATQRYFMGGYSVFVDVKTGKYLPRAEGLHTSCRIGLRAAYGLTYNSSLYMPGRFLQGDMAVESGGHQQAVPPGDPSRLETGPAFGSIDTSNSSSSSKEDWPTYRHNGRRTSQTSAQVPIQLTQRWAKDVGNTPTAPTIAAGKVFVASTDQHKVVAFDADDGKTLWTFTAGGPIRVPPTYAKGLCFFGAGDGWVYCLNASDGKLAWRFRAARTPRRIMAHGRVESAWPVENGVLVHDDLAYFAAGRHVRVDGGIDLYAVDCISGKLAWHEPMAEGGTMLMLLCDGKSISMRNSKARFSLQAAGRRPAAPGFHESAYDRDTLNLTHILGKSAITTFVPRGLLKAGTTIFATGHLPPGESEPPKIVWRSSRNPTLFENSPVRHPLDRSSAVPTEYKLWSFSEDDGTRLSEITLDTRPVFDAMAAAGGRLYISSEDGKLRCYGSK